MQSRGNQQVNNFFAMQQQEKSYENRIPRRSSQLQHSNNNYHMGTSNTQQTTNTMMSGAPGSMISNHYTGGLVVEDKDQQAFVRNSGAGEGMRLSDIVTNASQDGRATLGKDETCLSPVQADKTALGQVEKAGPAVSNSDIRQIKLNYLQLNKRQT